MNTLEPSPPVSSLASTISAPTPRLMSLDALRGFDMFWIICADSVVEALHRLAPNAVTTFLAHQLDHAQWAGFRFYDLIFPLFVFMVGVSIVFSLGRLIETRGRGAALSRVFRRGILLYVIGVFYSGGFASPWPDMRLLGVLNRIALCYFFAGLLFCLFRPRALLAIFAGLLLGYWAIMAWVPIRDIQLSRENIAQLAAQDGDADTAAYFQNPRSANASTVRNSKPWAETQHLFYSTTRTTHHKYEPGYNVANHLDFRFLPGKKWDEFYDPEGYLSTMPAVGTCLLGIFAGFLLRRSTFDPGHKSAILIGTGVVSVAAGWLWGIEFPVVKKIWTSSYVLVAGGYSAILLGVFHQIVDVWEQRAWCQPFVWIGMNSLTIYLAKNLMGPSFGRLTERFAGGDIRRFLDEHVAKGMGTLTLTIIGMLFVFWFVHFLAKRKVFLRL